MPRRPSRWRRRLRSGLGNADPFAAPPGATAPAITGTWITGVMHAARAVFMAAPCRRKPTSSAILTYDFAPPHKIAQRHSFVTTVDHSASWREASRSTALLLHLPHGYGRVCWPAAHWRYCEGLRDRVCLGAGAGAAIAVRTRVACRQRTLPALASVLSSRRSPSPSCRRVAPRHRPSRLPGRRHARRRSLSRQSMVETSLRSSQTK